MADQVKKNRQRWVGTLAIIAAFALVVSFIGWVASNKLTVEVASFREDRDPVYAAALSSCASRESKRLAISKEKAKTACRPGLDAIFKSVD